MARVVNLRFHDAGKPYRFLTGDLKLKVGDAVMVNTALGYDIAFVVDEPFDIPDEKIDENILPVLRFATDKEMDRYHDKREREEVAFKKCLALIEKHQLPMTLVEAVYAFDGKKLTFYFTAEKRVDFRELVKDLTACFHLRIELRQIGSREQAKMVGGLGICGRELCCCSYLDQFLPVTVRMAKDQGLSLNPTKLTGTCGRLMCCLSYEQAAYEDANKRVPKVGKKVKTPSGVGVVIYSDLLKEKVTVRLEKDEETELEIFDASEVSLVNPPQPQGKQESPKKKSQQDKRE
ncbi:MAG: stage 0 sporulation family protein [Clostridiales bacterium]|nr:stage 0 sporulation family protein [Candidatus Scatonaster coprocaballi]